MTRSPEIRWLPICNTTRTGQGPADLEVYFRIVHLAQVGQNRPLSALYREQTVEVALGPNGMFESGNMDLSRRAPPIQVRSAPPGNPKPARVPKTPRVVELLRKAIEWQALLESGKVISQAVIARQEGITRARVTQVLGLLRLSPEIQERISSLPDTTHRCPMTEKMLRPIRAIADHREQLREFQKYLL